MVTTVAVPAPTITSLDDDVGDTKGTVVFPTSGPAKLSTDDPRPTLIVSSDVLDGLVSVYEIDLTTGNETLLQSNIQYNPFWGGYPFFPPQDLAIGTHAFIAKISQSGVMSASSSQVEVTISQLSPSEGSSNAVPAPTITRLYDDVGDTKGTVVFPTSGPAKLSTDDPRPILIVSSVIKDGLVSVYEVTTGNETLLQSSITYSEGWGGYPCFLQQDLAIGTHAFIAKISQSGVMSASSSQVEVTISQLSPSEGSYSNPICFAKGTHILAQSEEVQVEVLATASTLQSQLGGLAKCRWIGYQRRTPEFAQFQDYLPVKIYAGALDDHVPLRDLYLSPDHAVLVDGHLIHAKALVNGKTIVQMTQWAGDIEYYHIETEAHEIIFAEGVPCETFIDNVSREQFDNYAEYQALYPNTRMMKELPLPRVKFKRQLPTMIKQRLESRITELDRQHKV